MSADGRSSSQRRNSSCVKRSSEQNAVSTIARTIPYRSHVRAERACRIRAPPSSLRVAADDPARRFYFALVRYPSMNAFSTVPKRDILKRCGSGPRATMQPRTQYVKGPEGHVAYQVFGGGSREIVFVPDHPNNIESMREDPS